MVKRVRDETEDTGERGRQGKGIGDRKRQVKQGGTRQEDRGRKERQGKGRDKTRGYRGARKAGEGYR